MSVVWRRNDIESDATALSALKKGSGTNSQTAERVLRTIGSLSIFKSVNPKI